MGSPNQLSFLPDDYLERKAARRTNAICAVLFLLVIGGVASAFTISENATKAIDKQYNKIEEQYVSEAKRIEQVRQMHEKQQRMARQAEVTASLLEKVRRSDILAEVTNCMSPGVSLLEFTLDSKPRQAAGSGPAPTLTAYEMKKLARENANKPKEEKEAVAKVFDVYMKVTGTAYNDGQVSQYIARLTRSKLLKDVNLAVTEEYVLGDDKLRKFQIEMMLDPDADLTNISKGEGRASVSVEEVK
jgi:Tfp pilus assembly protein PilN